MKSLSHIDDAGRSRMVDVGAKEVTARMARATACVVMQPETLALVRGDGIAKGNVVEVARLAGIMAAKRTADLIPLCHPVGLDSIDVSFEYPDDRTIRITAIARVSARTGVEMEALVAATTAALTIYDMGKSADRTMVIERVQLEEKSGGRSGHFRRDAEGT